MSENTPLSETMESIAAAVSDCATLTNDIASSGRLNATEEPTLHNVARVLEYTESRLDRLMAEIRSEGQQEGQS